MEPVELTLEDGSSVWLDRAAIVSFSVRGEGTRLVVLRDDGSEEQVDVADGFATVSDLMDPGDPAPGPGNFME